MSYEVANNLDAAADILERKGWVQGGSEGVDEPWDITAQGTCLEGALGAVIGDRVYSGSGTDRFVVSALVNACPEGRAVREFLDLNPSWPLWGWNDSDHRTKDEVLDALRGAAKYQRMKEDGLV